MASKKQRAARTVIDEAEEVFATPIATAPRTPEVTPHKRKLAEEFEADMADMSFSASSDVLTPIAKAMKKQTSGPVTFTLYFKAVRPGVNVPLGFGMFNTLDIRADLQQFVALEGGHHQPFFINEDILSKRRVSGWDSAWRIPAWFHAAYRTIETVEQLKPAMLAYMTFVQDVLGCEVAFERQEITPEKEEVWRLMQPKSSFLKRVGEPAAVEGFQA